MRLLVTGRTGQVSAALQALGADAAGDREGLTVVALGRPELDLAATPSVETLADLMRAHAPDAVINAAAHTAVDLAESEPDLAMRVNGHAPGALAAAARQLDVPFVHLSTDYVFDGRKPAPYLEDDATAPLGVYGRSKLAGEQAVAGHTPNHAIVRTAWVFGPRGRNFVRSMLRLAEMRSEIAVVADQVGAPTYAPDLADGLVAMARHLAEEPNRGDLRGVFHLANRGEASWADLADAVFAGARERGGPHATVRRIPTAEYPTPARRPSNSRLDTSRASARHGVVLPHWSDALDRCLDLLIRDGRVLSDAELDARASTPGTPSNGRAPRSLKDRA